MQLQPPTSAGPAARDTATALRHAAGRRGHRPAISVLLPTGRQEQSFASLQQWAAKGAHFLELEAELDPGDRLGLRASASWTTAAVLLSAWWAGLLVTLDGAAPLVVTDGAAPPPGSDALWLGDGLDGAPRPPATAAAWVHTVQTFPDLPPPPRAAADLPALAYGAVLLTQAELLERADAGGTGTLGIEAVGADPIQAFIDVALRPLMTGCPTVVLRGVGRDAARGDRVAHWR